MAFEDDFPSLKNKLLKNKDMDSADYNGYNGNNSTFFYVNKADVAEYCLDKQKVKKFIKSIKSWWEEHQHDTINTDDDQYNLYDEEPDFVVKMKELKIE